MREREREKNRDRRWDGTRERERGKVEKKADLQQVGIRINVDLWKSIGVFCAMKRYVEDIRCPSITKNVQVRQGRIQYIFLP